MEGLDYRALPGDELYEFVSSAKESLLQHGGKHLNEAGFNPHRQL